MPSPQSCFTIGSDATPVEHSRPIASAALVTLNTAPTVEAMLQTAGYQTQAKRLHIVVPEGIAGDPKQEYSGGFGITHILARHQDFGRTRDRLTTLVTLSNILSQLNKASDAAAQEKIALAWIDKRRYGGCEIPDGKFIIVTEDNGLYIACVLAPCASDRLLVVTTFRCNRSLFEKVKLGKEHYTAISISAPKLTPQREARTVATPKVAEASPELTNRFELLHDVEEDGDDNGKAEAATIEEPKQGQLKRAPVKRATPKKSAKRRGAGAKKGKGKKGFAKRRRKQPQRHAGAHAPLVEDTSATLAELAATGIIDRDIIAYSNLPTETLRELRNFKQKIDAVLPQLEAIKMLRQKFNKKQMELADLFAEAQNLIAESTTETKTLPLALIWFKLHWLHKTIKSKIERIVSITQELAKNIGRVTSAAGTGFSDLLGLALDHQNILHPNLYNSARLFSDCFSLETLEIYHQEKQSIKRKYTRLKGVVTQHPEFYLELLTQSSSPPLTNLTDVIVEATLFHYIALQKQCSTEPTPEALSRYLQLGLFLCRQKLPLLAQQHIFTDMLKILERQKAMMTIEHREQQAVIMIFLSTVYARMETFSDLQALYSDYRRDFPEAEFPEEHAHFKLFFSQAYQANNKNQRALTAARESVTLINKAVRAKEFTPQKVRVLEQFIDISMQQEEANLEHLQIYYDAEVSMEDVDKLCWLKLLLELVKHHYRRTEKNRALETAKHALALAEQLTESGTPRQQTLAQLHLTIALTDDALDTDICNAHLTEAATLLTADYQSNKQTSEFDLILFSYALKHALENKKTLPDAFIQLIDDNIPHSVNINNSLFDRCVAICNYLSQYYLTQNDTDKAWQCLQRPCYLLTESQQLEPLDTHTETLLFYACLSLAKNENDAAFSILDKVAHRLNRLDAAAQMRLMQTLTQVYQQLEGTHPKTAEQEFVVRTIQTYYYQLEQRDEKPVYEKLSWLLMAFMLTLLKPHLQKQASEIFKLKIVTTRDTSPLQYPHMLFDCLRAYSQITALVGLGIVPLTGTAMEQIAQKGIGGFCAAPANADCAAGTSAPLPQEALQQLASLLAPRG